MYCNRKYKDSKEAEKCYDSHDIVLMPIARTDLQKLLAYLYKPGPNLLNANIIHIMQRLLAASALRRENERV